MLDLPENVNYSNRDLPRVTRASTNNLIDYFDRGTFCSINTNTSISSQRED